VTARLAIRASRALLDILARRARLAWLAIVLLVLLGASNASAQTSSSQPKWEVGGGGVFVGGFDLGNENAELTSNSGTQGGTFDLFKSSSQLKPAFGVQARIGVLLSRLLEIEGGIRFVRPVLEIKLSNDTENAADVTAKETMNQYLFDGSAVWHLKPVSASGGATPFLYGGAGYIRDLHEDNALVEEGVEYHAGGGVKWWLGAGRSRWGIRAEGGVSIRDGGFDFKDGKRAVPVAAGSLIYVF
jgi:hypothetical protein